MTIKAGLVTSLYSRDIFFFFFCFILVYYQTRLWEKYLVTGDWSQSTVWDTSTDSKMDVLKFYDKYGKASRCPNI